ncbi:MAG: AMP-binding protein [Bdellovibrionales bacterium]|nr:AMP-binding protein [Bdellovibrionales bacterium]NQZ18673.1 AMP-binding protein [Bdellovibrionales bacterium]
MAEWHKKYPKGIDAEIDNTKYSSIVDLLSVSVNKFSEKAAFSNMGIDLTYSEVDRLSDYFASFLQNQCGLKPGDRIAIQMPNLLQFPVALFGAIKAGLIVVNTNPLYTEREMEHQFTDAGVKAVVILANFACHLEKIINKTKIEHVIITEIGDMFPPVKKFLVNSVVKYVKKMVPAYNVPGAHKFITAIEEGKEKAPNIHQATQDDIAFLQYTGGTTGVAKGAMLTHGNILANMNQIFAWMSPKFETGKEIIITPLPLYHIFSLTVNCLALMCYGGHNILITNPRDIPDFIKTLKKYPFTVMTGVNTLYNALINNKDFADVDFSHAKLSVAGAMALQDNVAKRWHEVTGTKVIEGYGLTEASPVVCCNPVDDTEQRGTIGIPLPSTQIRLVDDDGNEVAEGESGELCVKGPQVMKGYWERPEETANVIKDGWLHTGDVACMVDGGYFKIVDRMKDMILVSGFNVYPNEIEDVMANHPAVLEVAAVGVPDEKSGEAVKIFVVKKSEVSVDELRNFAKESLTGYKVPRYVEFRDDLPKTNVGKILRRELRN